MRPQAPTRILLVGRDVSILSSRANLLTQAGYSADCEVNQDRALRRTRTSQYQLVIISNSFNRDEQLVLRSKVKQVSPDLRVLLLSEDENEAELFLRAVRAVLQYAAMRLASTLGSLSARRGKEL